ncbi:trans-2,3-dihydro-3-hydroxyanthranilate isomerase [Kitasatospora sp. SolWspMP-SS2h]|uniref:hypothetical protein n=1 Tax=Kitasatospora sp. SolWspMP-SS2h TaxID=1305729 RepID=UPI000DBFD118|nr:hypothetical protein [Kitasatospora sp. SolWspMP-SS2h]RAJ43070.1 trans-2,3-dihydro-3-hydroxyanthranilate isomerase [Kitasatospora sp. SolWspMP-SS2h]
MQTDASGDLPTMIVSWWELGPDDPSVQDLEADLSRGVDDWASCPGLLAKYWLADRERNRWGGVMVWERRPAADLPVNRAAQLIGRPADVRTEFAVPKIVHGVPA